MGTAPSPTSCLTTLASHNAVATAFVVGTWLDANPDFAELLRKHGHELANHTYTHPTFHRLAPAAMATEVTKCRDLLERLEHTNGTFFRPSGTSNGVDTPTAPELQAAGDAGYATVVGYDVDPSDYADPGRDQVISRTIAAIKPGSIVSLHFGHQGTIDALPEILTTISSRGLRLVTTSALLAA